MKVLTSLIALAGFAGLSVAQRQYRNGVVLLSKRPIVTRRRGARPLSISRTSERAKCFHECHSGVRAVQQLQPMRGLVHAALVQHRLDREGRGLRLGYPAVRLLGMVSL